MMDDRKQEAIEVIHRYSQFWYNKGLDDGSVPPPVKDYPNTGDAKALYDRIAPLTRGEFPEAKVLQILLRCYHKQTDSHYALEKLKRLFEGDHIVEDDKKVCQMCGGSGWLRVCKCGSAKLSKHGAKCPQCKGAEEAPDMKPEYDFSKGKRGRVVPRRSGEERRKQSFFGVAFKDGWEEYSWNNEVGVYTLNTRLFSIDGSIWRTESRKKDRRN